MITQGKSNFFADHYDWLVVGLGVLALLAGGGYFAMQLSIDAEADAAAAVQRVERMKPQETGVKPVEMTELDSAVKQVKAPDTLVEIDPIKASYLASEWRVKCKKCGKAIQGDIKLCEKCPACGEAQEKPVEVVLDADNDGLPDEWEKKFGFNPADPSDAAKDFDNDGFTNLEEFEAKTDPVDRKDHPDYLDSLKIQLPLKETTLPFVFRRADKIPAGYRLTFFDSTSESAVDKRKKGANVTAVIGEEIGKTGFVVKGYTPKSEKRERKGMAGKVEVDVSEAVVERVKDKKCVTLVVQPKGLKYAAVDVQATLVYERNGVRNFEVVPGSELDLNGKKYVVKAVVQKGKKAEVTIADAVTQKERILASLD